MRALLEADADAGAAEEAVFKATVSLRRADEVVGDVSRKRGCVGEGEIEAAGDDAVEIVATEVTEDDAEVGGHPIGEVHAGSDGVLEVVGFEIEVVVVAETEINDADRGAEADADFVGATRSEFGEDVCGVTDPEIDGTESGGGADVEVEFIVVLRQDGSVRGGGVDVPGTGVDGEGAEGHAQVDFAPGSIFAEVGPTEVVFRIVTDGHGSGHGSDEAGFFFDDDDGFHHFAGFDGASREGCREGE
jgi:hypothetical protein